MASWVHNLSYRLLHHQQQPKYTDLRHFHTENSGGGISQIIIYCAMYLYVGYINEATNFAESQGGGGSDTKDWGRDKDEDEIEWIRRCLQKATRMMKPRKSKGLSR